MIIEGPRNRLRLISPASFSYGTTLHTMRMVSLGLILHGHYTDIICMGEVPSKRILIIADQTNMKGPSIREIPRDTGNIQTWRVF